MLLKRVLRRGIERKLLPATLDLDEAMALLLGPILYMKIFQDVTPTGDLGRKVAESFWRGHVSGSGTRERAVKPAK